jgi:transcriptional pleiotropic regulator of transition state genes
MRSTGIVRKVDQLGRVVLPKELRSTMGIDGGTAMEFFTEGETIILRKYEPGCTFCGEMVDKLIPWRGKIVCRGCMRGIEAVFEEMP